MWHGFSNLDTMFANRYGDCFWQLVVYARLACGQYREIYVAEIRLAEGCDSLMHDITTGTVTMQQVIDAMVKSLIWEDAMTYSKILGIDSLDPNMLLCSNGGFTYYRVYKGNCGFWGRWEEYETRRKYGDVELAGIRTEVDTVVVGRIPKWRYRRCSDACCIDGWHVCWMDLPDYNMSQAVSVNKIYSSQGVRCMNVHGPYFEICYYNCADSAALGQWIVPEDGGVAEEITGVADQRLQGWYHYDPRSQELWLYMHFASPQPFSVALYNLQGKKVFEVEEPMVRQEQYIRLYLQDLPAGAYILHLQGADVEWQTLVRIW